MASAPTDSPRQAVKASGMFMPELLGAGMLFAVFLNAIRFVSGNNAFPVAPMLVFSVATGVGLIASSVVLAALSALGRKAKRAAPDPLSPAVLVPGFGCAFLGLLSLLPTYANMTLPFLEPAVLGVVFGVGLMLLATAWGALFARLEPESLLFNSALGVIVAAVLHVAAAPFSPGPTGLAIIACSFVASAVLLVRARTRMPDAPERPAESAPPRHPGGLRKALLILWMPLVGAGITCFIFGLTWDPVISSEQNRLIDPLGDWKSLIGPSLLAAIVAILAVCKADSSPLRLVNQIVYPIAVALLLALPVIVPGSNLTAGIVDVLTQASFAVIALSIWCSMASASRSVPLPATMIIPACLLLLALAFVTGLQGIALIGTDGRTMCLVILTLYLALIAVSFALGNKSQKERRTEARAAADSRTYIHRCCDALAAERGLSPREREVLYYLGRGYNHGYVAEKLYISENTVRTHVRHIYGKLDVSSREELLALIDATADAAGE